MKVAMDGLEQATSYKAFVNKNVGVAYEHLGLIPTKRLPRKIKKQMKAANELIMHDGKYYVPSQYKEQSISVVK